MRKIIIILLVAACQMGGQSQTIPMNNKGTTRLRMGAGIAMSSSASRTMPIVPEVMDSVNSKDGMTYGKKQPIKIQRKKGKGFFKKLFLFGKWKKVRISSEKIGPGQGALIALIAGVGCIFLAIIPSLGIFYLLGIGSLITAWVLGNDAKNNSTGKDQKMGSISMQVAKGLLIVLAILTLIALIVVLYWLASFSIF